jgi:hypothetical protein
MLRSERHRTVNEFRACADAVIHALVEKRTIYSTARRGTQVKASPVTVLTRQPDRSTWTDSSLRIDRATFLRR